MPGWARACPDDKCRALGLAQWTGRFSRRWTLHLETSSFGRICTDWQSAAYHRGPMLKNKSEVLAAALDQTNLWLAETLERPDLHLELVSQATARRTVLDFERGAGRHRKVHWNWEDLFFTHVRYKDAWMYAMVRGGLPRAMCFGRIEIVGGHVALGLRGVTALAAFQFARAVALLFDLDEVRLNDPFPQLVRYYERTLNAVRHPAAGPVKYLYVKVKP
jgi:hypothetical protein